MEKKKKKKAQLEGENFDKAMASTNIYYTLSIPEYKIDINFLKSIEDKFKKKKIDMK